MQSDELGQALRKRRREAGLGLRELSRAAEISPASLSEIERDKSSPTLASLHRILRALGTDFGEFFAAGTREEETPVFRAEGMKAIEDAHRRYRLLLPKRADIRFEAVHETISPSEPEDAWETHDCDVAGVVLRGGPAQLEFDDSRHWPVRPDDAFYVKAGQRHRLRATGHRAVELVTIWCPPRY